MLGLLSAWLSLWAWAGLVGESRAQELVCVSASHCVPWGAACFYAKAYCVDGQGSSCGAVDHLCGRREDANWCAKDEVWERCWSADRACEASCDTLERPESCEAEVADCRASRCLCRPGFRRARNNSCVPAYKCQRCRWALTSDAIPVTREARPRLVGQRLKTLRGSTDAAALAECRLVPDCDLVVALPFTGLRLLLHASAQAFANSTTHLRQGYHFHRKTCTLI